MKILTQLIHTLRLFSPVALILICPVSFGAAPVQVPLEAFFAEADIRSVKLSPDGKSAAFLTTLGWGRVGIALLDLANPGKAPEALVSAKDENIKQFFWKGNDYIVYGGDIGGDESYAWRSVQVAPSKPGEKRRVRALSEARFVNGDVMEIIDDLPFDSNRVLIFGVREPGSRSLGVYTLDIRTGRRQPVASYDPPPAANDWAAFHDGENVTDNNGILRARLRLVGDRVIYEARPEPTGRYAKIADFPAPKGHLPWQMLFFASDNETLYLLSTEHSDTNTLHSYNVRTRQMSAPLFHSDQGDIVAVNTSWDRSRLYSVTYETDRPQVHYFDPVRQKLKEMIDQSLPPGTRNTIVSSSIDEQIHIILAASDRDPGTYYVLDRQRGRMAPLGRALHNISPPNMAPMEPIQYTARDGMVIHGYLTRPAAAANGPVPLILNPHGGPFGIRDHWGFNPEVQFLANRGYAVLQVNFRGSGGYGVRFQQAGYREWGGKMQNDLTDAVQWAVSQGITTSDRVAIYGASYGGYATLAGLAFTPELYRCGINYVGPSDLRILVSGHRQSSSDFLATFDKDQLGDDREYLRTRSPVHFVERIRAPLLNAYGFNDARVDIEHWKLLEPELKRFGKTYEIIIDKNEGHGFRNENARLQFYRRMETFLGRYLASDAPSARPGELRVVEMPAKEKP